MLKVFAALSILFALPSKAQTSLNQGPTGFGLQGLVCKNGTQTTVIDYIPNHSTSTVERAALVRDALKVKIENLQKATPGVFDSLNSISQLAYQRTIVETRGLANPIQPIAACDCTQVVYFVGANETDLLIYLDEKFYNHPNLNVNARANIIMDLYLRIHQTDGISDREAQAMFEAESRAQCNKLRAKHKIGVNSLRGI